MESILPERRCITCGGDGPFYKNTSRKDGLDPYCTGCRKLRVKSWKRRHPHKQRAYYQKWYGKHCQNLYNLTLDELRKLEDRSQGRCEICGDEFNHTPFVDHDHTTGKVRGLLCRKCNSALGFVDDSIDRLNKLIAYLTVNR